MLTDEKRGLLLSVVDPNWGRIPSGQGSNRKAKWHKQKQKKKGGNSIVGREVFSPNHVQYVRM